MDRRKFVKQSGKSLLALTTISITGLLSSSCSPESSSDDDFFDDGYYDDAYYDDGYYDDGYYDDGYYDDGYYDDGYYDDGYYDDGYYDDGYYDDGYYDDGYYDDGYYDDGYYDDGYYDDGYYDDGYYDDGYYDSDAVADILLNGSWFVETYIDSGSNDTAIYNGYTVNFNTGNAVVASNGSNTINGTWLVTSNGSQLNLAFPSSPFDEFNDEWDIHSVSENRVEIRDVSGGGGGTDILVFEKL